MMTAAEPRHLASVPESDQRALARAVLGHLDAQLASARRLHALVVRQGQAVRERDVDAVLVRLSEIQGEMTARGRLESHRTQILSSVGEHLGVPAAQVTLTHLASLMPPAEAEEARRRSGELRGLLNEIAREHGINRALMRQELSFLHHLTRLVGGEPEPGYGRTGAVNEPPPSRPAGGASLRVLDHKA
jgi:hypothetical protein